MTMSTNTTKSTFTSTISLLNPSSPTQQDYVNIEILSPGLRYTLNTLYVIATILGMTGNGLVCCLFIAKKVKYTAFNLLLLNLSIADILADMSTYPYVFADLSKFRSLSRKHADIACAFTIGLTPFVVASAVSVVTLSYISLNRYAAIRFPLRAKKWFKNQTNAIVFIAILWPLAILMLLPNAYSFKFNPTYAICPRTWPKNFNGKIWSTSISIIGFALPLTTLLFTFVATVRCLWIKKCAMSNGKGSLTRKRKAAVLLGALIVAFFVCWGPFFGYFILSRSVKRIFPAGVRGEFVRMKVVRFVCLIAVCNTVADPLVYAFRSDEFRQGFMDILNGISIRITSIKSSARSISMNEESADAGDLPIRQFPSSEGDESQGGSKV